MAITLTHSPARVMAQLLVDLGLGIAPGTPGDWPVSWSGEPDRPDKAITVTNTTPIGDGRVMKTGEIMAHYGFQVRVRAPDDDGAWIKVIAVCTALEQSIRQNLVTIAGKSYTVWCVADTNGPVALGKEVGVSKRSLYTINAKVTLTALN